MASVSTAMFLNHVFSVLLGNAVHVLISAAILGGSPRRGSRVPLLGAMGGTCPTPVFHPLPHGFVS